MKRSVTALLCALILAAMLGLAACSSGTTEATDNSSAEPAATTNTDTQAEPAATAPSNDDAQYTMGDMCLVDVYELDGVLVADLAYQIINVGSVPFDVEGTYLCLADASGNPIVDAEDATVLVAPEIVDPGSTAFVYTTVPVVLPEGTAADGDYYAGGEVYLAALGGEIVEYPVSNVQLAEQGGKPVLSGTVTNDTDVAAEPVQVSVLFLGADDELLGVTSVLIPAIAAGESYDFATSVEGLPTGCTIGNCAAYDAVALGYSE